MGDNFCSVVDKLFHHKSDHFEHLWKRWWIELLFSNN